MGIKILRTMKDFVNHIESIEEEEDYETLFASSYFSSHLFPKSVLAKYFVKDMGTNETTRKVVDDLWRRSKKIHANLKRVNYREIYEIDALHDLCKNGLVHRQMPSFVITPKEIVGVLQATISLLQNSSKYQVAFCRGVLPFVFVVKSGRNITIDVRNNFGYQRIQGFLIDEPAIVTEFENEFWQIWNDETTTSDRNQVIKLLENKIYFVENTARYISE